MALKKSPYKKRPVWGRLPQSGIVRAMLSLAALVLVVTLISVTADHLLARRIPADTAGTGRVIPPRPAAEESVAKIPVYEIFPPPEVHSLIDSPAPPSGRSTPETKPLQSNENPEITHEYSRPRVVIIIDDIGYNSKIVDQYLSLNLPITFSVLPFAPRQRRVVKKLQARHCEIMLHLPMEPREYPQIDPGPGALLTSMTPAELRAHLDKALDAIPQAIGVNNHMGSRVTTNAKQMYQILSVLKRRGLFFIDSKTANKTVSRNLARTLKLPYAERTIFLDNQLNPEKIKRQLMQLVQVARKRGVAIGIGHPHRETFQVLARELPRLKKEIQLVPASSLVHIIG